MKKSSPLVDHCWPTFVGHCCIDHRQWHIGNPKIGRVDNRLHIVLTFFGFHIRSTLCWVDCIFLLKLNFVWHVRLVVFLFIPFLIFTKAHPHCQFVKNLRKRSKSTHPIGQLTCLQDRSCCSSDADASDDAKGIRTQVCLRHRKIIIQYTATVP